MVNIPHNFKPFLAYSASAGSGKTFALSVRYLSLLFMGESPSSILAATFTNKAAAEMRQRVIDSLRTLQDDNNSAFVDALLSETGLSKEELLSKQAEVLNKFLSTKSSIVTLDSFFSSILRSASLELGLEPDFITKDQQHEELEMHFLEEIKRENSLGSLVKISMDIEDKRLTKIFDLMQNLYKVDPLLPKQPIPNEDLIAIEKNIEYLCNSLVDQLTHLKAPARCLKQFETNNIKELSTKGLFEKESLGEHSWYKKYSNEDIESLYSQLKSTIEQWMKSKETIILHVLFTIYDYYKNATITNLRASGVLSFDDLTYMTHRLLHESISSDFLYFKIDNKFKHILLDEFQDTSTLQFLLLKPLIDEIFAGKGQSEFKSFFYVGDTKQSLYRFRGGVEELFERVAHNYGISIENMDTNYRSSKFVVAQVNNWFVQSMPEYIEQKSRDGAEDGYVLVTESDDPIEQALTQIEQLLEIGIPIDAIACLVNTNKDGLTLQEACEASGIPTILKTTSSLKYQPKIAALVAMVKYLFYGEKINAEALLIRVGSTLEEKDLNWFHPFMEPVALLDKLVRTFGYFTNDISILKLLEFASSFRDIPTFLYEFDTSSISVAGDTLAGLMIMTIHGSKGLEFDHVILLDKLTRKNSDRSPLIFHYNDHLYIDQILYRNAKRENFDNEYRSILQNRKISAQKDHMNVLYVALTRAIHGLTVICKPKESIFDDIGLSPMQRGKLCDKSKRNNNRDTITNKPSTPPLVHNYGIQKTPVPQESDDLKDWDAILFGIALHYLLEMLSDFTQVALDEAMVSLQNRYGQLLNRESMDDIYRRVLTLIEHRDFMNLLNGATVSKEQSLSFAGELKQIDLLLEYDEHFLVVDYKSSLKYAQSHQKQVLHYQKAIEQISHKETKSMIIYLLEEKIFLKSLN